MEVIVIGAGASGLVSAINWAQKGAKVTVLERNNKVGKKLLLTGNGRCNYWHRFLNINNYETHHVQILEEIISDEEDNVLDFFASLGIIPKVINNCYYPFSNQTTSIVNALSNKAQALKVNIIFNTLVTNIYKDKKFIINTDTKSYQADKVVIACGLKAAPKTGSDASLIPVLANLGHTIYPIYPALTRLIGNDSFYHDWDGVRAEVKLSLWENQKLIKEELGEVQLTKNGISGIVAFNLSGHIAKGLAQDYSEKITINFVPWYPQNKLKFKNWLNYQAKLVEPFNVTQLLEGFLNYKIVNLILKLTKTKPDSKWSKVNQDLIIDYLLSFPFSVKEVDDFDSAQVCTGGVSLEEINPQTLESKKVKDLYFVGEVIDADGICGGYNLGLAWITGLKVGGRNDSLKTSKNSHF